MVHTAVITASGLVPGTNIHELKGFSLRSAGAFSVNFRDASVTGRIIAVSAKESAATAVSDNQDYQEGRAVSGGIYVEIVAGTFNAADPILVHFK